MGTPVFALVHVARGKEPLLINRLDLWFPDSTEFMNSAQRFSHGPESQLLWDWPLQLALGVCHVCRFGCASGGVQKVYALDSDVRGKHVRLVWESESAVTQDEK